MSTTLNVYDDFTALPESVRRAWATACDDDPCFTTQAWFELLFRHTGQDLGGLRLFTLDNSAGECVGILPCVALPASRMRGRVLTALTNYYSPVYRLITPLPQSCRESCIEGLLAALARRRDWDVMHLGPLHEAGELELWERAAHALKVAHFRAQATTNWTQTLCGTFEDYARTRPGQVKATLRRKGAKLRSCGPHEFVIYTGANDTRAGDARAGETRASDTRAGNTGAGNLDRAIADYENVYAQSWKRPEAYPGFVPDLIRLAARHRQLRLGILYVSNQPAAAQLWLVHGSVAEIYKLAYADRFTALSPGTLLTMHMFEHVVRRDGVTSVDFLTGNDPYKRDWMSTSRIMYTLTLTNPRTARGQGQAGYRRMRALAKRVRDALRPEP